MGDILHSTVTYVIVLFDMGLRDPLYKHKKLPGNNMCIGNETTLP